MLLRNILVILWLLGLSTVTHAQDHNEGDNTHASHGNFALAGFIGSTRAHGHDEFTLAIEGGMHLNEKWSVGAVLERANREKDSTLALVGVGWHPVGPELRIQFGVGRKDPAGKEENVFRTGLGYEIELTNGWFVKPYLAVDFIENEDNERVYGFYIGRTF